MLSSRFIAILAILLFSQPRFCISQNVGSASSCGAGRVVDIGSGEAIPGATIYVSGSSRSALADKEGYFTLRDWMHDSLHTPIVVSAAGYVSRSIVLRGCDSVQIGLEKNIVELKEVVLQPNNSRWKPIFEELIIGYSEFSKKCTILNPSVLRFYYDEATGNLEVFTNSELLVRNEATGYTIHYWVEKFPYNTRSGQLDNFGYYYFEDLIPTGVVNKKRVERNRKSAYLGSMQHFFRTIHVGTSTEEGFELRHLHRVKMDTVRKSMSVRLDTIWLPGNDPSLLVGLLGNQVKKLRNRELADEELAMLGRVSDWYRTAPDTAGFKAVIVDRLTGDRDEFFLTKVREKKGAILIDYFKLNKELARKVKNGMLDVLEPAILDPKRFVSKDTAGNSLFRISPWLQVTYRKEPAEQVWVERSDPLGLRPAQANPPQESLIRLADIPVLTIYPDGSFREINSLFVEGYWTFERLDKMLPQDFLPTW